jgi:hypothetical protein
MLAMVYLGARFSRRQTSTDCCFTAKRLVPAWGLSLAALFGESMANLSSDFNSLSAIAVSDYFQVWKPRSTNR